LTLRISEITTEDIPALRSLFLTVRQTTFSWLDTTSYKLTSFDKETEGEFILVAHFDTTVAGFISAWIPDNFIHHLYIKNEFQGIGLGSQLLRAITDKLKFPITLKCLQENKEAISFYKKNGFIQKENGLSDEGIYILFEYNN
jgi:ribosomal protein S18 acetylase RimI-like enzyme